MTRDRAMTLAKCSQNGKALIVAEVAILVGRSFGTTLHLPVLQLTLQASFTLHLPVLQLTLQGSFTLGYIGTSERALPSTCNSLKGPCLGLLYNPLSAAFPPSLHRLAA